MFRPLWKPALFVCLCFLYLHGLADVGLLGPDEPRYAFIGRDMARTGDWVTPRLWGEPWFEKPALLYWMTGVAYATGFSDDWAPRIGVALLSVAFLAFYYHQVRGHFGPGAAMYATAILSTSAGWFAYSQIGVTDLPMAALFAAALLVALGWLGSGGALKATAIGALLGGAVLAKGLVPLVLAVPLAWFGRRRWRELLVLGLVCIAVAAPWYVLCYARNGWPFIQEFFIEHHFGRFATQALKHVQPFWFYVPVVVAGLFPWSPLVLLAFNRSDLRDQRRFLLLATLVFGFLFFSASTNKLPGYMLPLFPPLAALAGIHLAERQRAAGWIAVCVVLLGAVPVVGQVLPDALDQGLSRATLTHVAWWSLGVAAILGALSWWLETHRGRSTALVVGGVTAAAAILYLQATVYPVLDARVSARGMYRSSHPDCVAARIRRQTIYGLNFYAGRQLPECSESQMQSR